MKRNVWNDLKKWSEDEESQTMLLTGVRGCGKTFCALQFANECFERHIYINPEESMRTRKFFEQLSENTDFDGAIREYTGTENLNMSGILIIIDEIFASNRLLALLNARKQDFKCKVLIISSQSVNLPNSAVRHIKMYPLTFDEFLIMSEREWYREVITGHFERKKKIPGLIHDELCDIYDEYLTTGGMPAVIRDYLSQDNRDIQMSAGQKEYENWIADIRKYSEEKTKESDIMDVICSQRENNTLHFKFNLIRKGASMGQYAGAINSLVEDNKIIRVNSITDEGFRLYYADFGILGGRLRAETCLEESAIREECQKCSLIQTFTAKGRSLHYWNSVYNAGIDAIIEISGKYIPVDIVTEASSRKRGLKVYSDKYSPSEAVRISEKNFDFSDGLLSVPLYAAFLL